MLYLHRSSRADYLVEALGDVLLQPLPDPMSRDVVAVPTRGVERWLTQRLSHRLGATPGERDGVAANIEFPFPGVLIASAMRAAAGGAAGPVAGADPWSPERSVWPLLQLVDEHLDDPLMRPLAAHLRASSPAPPDGTPRRFTSVRHLADLFDQYAVHRPGMLAAWERHDEGTLTSARPEDMAWQAELWRLLRRRLVVPSPAERFESAPRRIEAEPGLVDLPQRVSLFGLTRLPSSHLNVLKAIAVHRDVHLFLLHPSHDLWEEVASRAPHPPPSLLRKDDPTARLPKNPLLRSWGRDAREMQLVLAGHGITGGTHRPVDAGEMPKTLLGRIQADIRADRTPPGSALLRHLVIERRWTQKTHDHCWRTTTTACGCIRAMAAPARSKLCARRSCTCWRTTPPSSPAT